MDIKCNYYNQLQYVETKISSKLLEEIKVSSSLILDNIKLQIDHRKELAGNIEKEFLISEDLSKKLEPYVLECALKFDHEVGNSNRYYKLVNPWINFQKKFEYNPFHKHNGVYSFVLWVNIPYDLDNELSLENCKYSNTKSNSSFYFFETSMLGEITTTQIFVSKEYEGTMILFPSLLNHTVYPFYTSDDYRISISGNLFLSERQKVIEFDYQ